MLLTKAAEEAPRGSAEEGGLSAAPSGMIDEEVE